MVKQAHVVKGVICKIEQTEFKGSSKLQEAA